MSAILETTSTSSPNRTVYGSKKIKDILNTSSIDSNEFKQITERMHYNREPTVKTFNDLYLKETERFVHPTNKNSPILLSQQTQSPKEREDQWQFNENKSQTCQQIKGIESFLQNQGVLEVFRKFEQFRTLLIDSLNLTQTPLTTNSKIELYQAIASLKIQLSKFNVSQLQPSLDQVQMKFILSQLLTLRKENCILRQKISSLTGQLYKQQHSRFLSQNSLINNSIQIIDSSISMSDRSYDSSVQLDLQFQRIITSNSMEPQKKQEISRTLSIENSFKKIFQTSQLQEKSSHCQQFKQDQIIRSVIVSQPNKTVMNACFLKHNWIEIIKECVQTSKQLFKNHFEACNLALLKSQQRIDLTNILLSFKEFKVQSFEKTYETYVTQSSKLIKFIDDHSNRMARLISNQLQRYKTTIIP